MAHFAIEQAKVVAQIVDLITRNFTVPSELCATAQHGGQGLYTESFAGCCTMCFSQARA